MGTLLLLLLPCLQVCNVVWLDCCDTIALQPQYLYLPRTIVLPLF
jgi:hypothetical protein